MAAIDVDQIKTKAIAAYRAFTPAQLVLAGLLTVLTVVGGLMFYSWVSAPTYAVLYSGLDAKDTADVTTQLTADKIAYKLTGNGTTVEVPTASLDKERVALAGAGLPKGGTGGWETLDKEGLTTSSFRQQVDYQRALEGEIAKTLQSIDGVDAASVHLVMPQERLFTDQQRNARASVMLTTRRTLGVEQVQAVVSTISSAVPDLDPAAVTVTDSTGKLLSSKSGGSDDQSSQQANYEDGQTAHAQSMLDQLLGAGHSVVRVSATLNFDKTKSTVKTENAKKTAVTGSEKTTETYASPDASTAAGALTTNMTTTLPGAASGATNYKKTTETSTTVPSEQLDEIQKATGVVTRQSVAVVLDTGSKSLPPNAEVQQLVAAAIGLDPKRGDTIVVSSAGFDTGPAVTAKPSSKGLLGAKSLSTGVAAIMLVLITLLLARSARKPKVKAIALPEVLPALTAPAAAAAAALPAGRVQAALPAGSSGGPRAASDEASIDLLQAVESQPDDVAHLLRGWMSEDRDRAVTLAYESRTGSGRRKAAIALVALGAERAAVLLRDLDEDEVRQLAAEVAALGPVAPDEVRATLRELQGGLADVQTLPAPGTRFARDLLVRALGAEDGDRVAAQVETPAPFFWLAGADAEQAAEALAVEPPSVVALALAHLPGRTAARVLTRLPGSMRTEVATRIANLSTVHPETVLEVDAALHSRVGGVLAAEVVPVAGPDVLAEILTFTDRDAEKEVMTALTDFAPDLAEQVRAALFTFDDVAALEARALQTLLKGVETRELALALKNAEESVLSKILGNLSERARDGLLEEIDLLTSIRPADIDAARKGIVATARRLEEEGVLTISRPEDN